MTAILTGAAFPPEQQDSMEITTEPKDDDVDLEIDYEDDAIAYADEVEMQEDAQPQKQDIDVDIELRSATADLDDYMRDDITITEDQVDVESVMVDEPHAIQQQAQQEDEELLDLSDDEDVPEHDISATADGSHDPSQHLDNIVTTSTTLEPLADVPHFDHTHDDAVETGTTLPAHTVVSAIPPAHDEPDSAQLAERHDTRRRIVEDAGISDTHSDHKHDAQADDVFDGDEQEEGRGDNEAQVEKNEAAPQEEDNLADDLGDRHDGSDKTEQESHNTEQAQDHASLDEVASVQQDLGDDSPESPSSRSADGQQTSTGLHPTVVKYEDGEYLLFPPDEPNEGDEYFLQDENLVNGSINDLLKACRLTLSSAISDDEELEMHVEGLELNVVEDSAAAFSTSFSDLLEVFVQLHHHDGVEAPPALVVSLSTRPRFASRFFKLVQAASRGQGLSSMLAFDEVGNDPHKPDDELPHEEGGLSTVFEDEEEDSVLHHEQAGSVDSVGTDQPPVVEVVEHAGESTIDTDLPSAHITDGAADVEARGAPSLHSADDSPHVFQAQLLPDSNDDGGSASLHADHIEKTSVTVAEALQDGAGVAELSNVDLAGPSLLPNEAAPAEALQPSSIMPADTEKHVPGTDLTAASKQKEQNGSGEVDEEADEAFDEIDFDDEELRDGEDSKLDEEANAETQSSGSKRKHDASADDESADAKRSRPSVTAA